MPITGTNQYSLYKIDFGHPLGVYYAVATDPSSAYRKIRKYLDEEDYAFPTDRDFKSIHYLASQSEHPSENKLFL